MQRPPYLRVWDQERVLYAKQALPHTPTMQTDDVADPMTYLDAGRIDILQARDAAVALPLLLGVGRFPLLWVRVLPTCPCTRCCPSLF